ncbi:hypothetical protein ACE6H2_005875 [Prunus campanulata]
MDPNLTPNSTLSITEARETETPTKSANSLTADLVHGLQQCRGNTMFWKNLHADIVSKIVEGQARWGVIKNRTIRYRYHARMHLLHIKEFSFSFRQLQQLGELYHASYPNFIRLEALEDIYVHGVHDAEQLIHVLEGIQALIAIDHTQLPVKLIIIDSIAALFRSQYEATPADLKRRCEMFFKISGTLKALANKFGVAMVVTNQVVDFIGPHHGINGGEVGKLGVDAYIRQTSECSFGTGLGRLHQFKGVLGKT